ncbi:MAG: formylglycine-generating enzyme family protein [Planctomycetaceae bacterium]
MGKSDGDDENSGTDERLHLRQIPRSFAIAMHEVTVADYQRFDSSRTSPDPLRPVSEISWVDAAKYCRWLSEQEGIPEEEMCYPPSDQIGAEMMLPENFLERTGYRLPTGAEWEFSCRAGTSTSRPAGGKEQTHYCAWYRPNSDDHTWPVGRLDPNGLGLFDSVGNVWEWCHDLYFGDYPMTADGTAVVDGTDHRESVERETRGGAYADAGDNVRSSRRDFVEPFVTSYTIGFRLARTIRE